MTTLFLLFLLLMPALDAYPLSDGCNPDKLTVYRMVLRTYWTREKFPKHYPDWRPLAQWSKIYGVSHDPSFVLFRLGKRVTPNVREFAESARSDSLGVSSRGVMDTFGAGAILQGAGSTTADFHVDGNHSRISLMSRMIPSPDWFIGVDSFDLCVDGNWLDSITVELDPLDAGTDNGFTFTAQNWPTSPLGVAYRITSRYPSHPAGSFYYPHMRRLPPIATVQFIKLREYEVSEVFHRVEDSNRYDILELERQAENSIDTLDGNRALNVAEEEERQEETLVIHTKDGTIYDDGPKISYTLYTNDSLSTSTQEPRSANELLPNIDEDSKLSLKGLARRYKARRRRKFKNEQSTTTSKPDIKRKRKKTRTIFDCRVSTWSEWSECAGGCGVGESRRTRRVVRRARPGGKPCPPLTQTRWCATTTAINCTSEPNPFEW